jgi:hypothetical protein
MGVPLKILKMKLLEAGALKKRWLLILISLIS